jgi:hypothetical protein
MSRCAAIRIRRHAPPPPMPRARAASNRPNVVGSGAAPMRANPVDAATFTLTTVAPIAPASRPLVARSRLVVVVIPPHRNTPLASCSHELTHTYTIYSDDIDAASVEAAAELAEMLAQHGLTKADESELSTSTSAPSFDTTARRTTTTRDANVSSSPSTSQSFRLCLCAAL